MTSAAQSGGQSRPRQPGRRLFTLALTLCFLPRISGSAGDPSGYNVHWLGTGRGPLDDQATAVATDANGDVLVAGSFQATASFGATNVTSAGNTDAFVARTDSNGHWLWVRAYGGTGADQTTGLAVSPTGITFVSGHFQGDLTANGTTLTNRGGTDAFVLALDRDGQPRWMTRFGGPFDDRANAIALTQNGRVLVTGHFEDVADFGSTNLTSRGAIDVFLAQLDPDTGALDWAISGGGDSTDDGLALATRDARTVVCGIVGGDATFGAINVTNAPGTQVFTAGLDDQGRFLWAQCGGSTGQDLASAATLDDEGNATVAGYFAGPATLGGFDLTNAGPRYLFIARYDPDGTLSWLRALAGYEARALASSGSGGVTLAGAFTGTQQYGARELHSPSAFDALLLQHDPAGNVTWARQAGGTNSEFAQALATDSIGNLYVAGRCTTNSVFDAFSLTNALRDEVFLIKLSPAPVITQQPQNIVTNAGASVSFQVAALGAEPLAYQWMHQGTNTLQGATNPVLTLPAVSPASSGSYAAVVTNFFGGATSAPATLAVFGVSPPLVRVENQVGTNFIFTNALTVTITLDSETADVRLFYTLDGSSPGFTSTEYLQPFAVNDSVTVRAIAYNAALTSAESPAVPVVLTLSPPVVDVDGVVGQDFTFTNVANVTVSIAAGVPEARIHYTTDDSVPSTNSPVYQGPFAISESIVLRAFAITDHLQSDPAVLARIQLLHTHALVVAPNADGIITAIPAGGVYLEGTTIQLQAAPANGWFFLHWAGDASGSNTTTTIQMDSDRSVAAVFGTLLTLATNGNGSISVTPGLPLFPRGTFVQARARRGSDSFFTTWFGTLESTNNPASFLIDGPNPVLGASFSLIPSGLFLLELEINGRGAVDVNPALRFYTNGQTAVLSAEPAPADIFLKWTGDLGTRENPLTLLFSAHRQIVANFSGGSFLSLEEPELVGQTNFHFTLLGNPLGLYQIEGATNTHSLLEWTNRLSVTNLSGTDRVTQIVSPITGTLFLRARSTPTSE